MAKIDTLFKMLIQENGSDLHLEQGQKPRLRRHGELKAIENEDILSQEQILDYMREIAEDRNWSHFEQKGDLDFAYALGEDARFRANYFLRRHPRPIPSPASRDQISRVVGSGTSASIWSSEKLIAKPSF